MASGQYSRRALLRAIPSVALVAAVPAVALAAPHPDAELIRLGVEFERAWAVEKDSLDGGDFETAADATSEIVEAIERLTATTFEGFKVQARALSWCLCEETEMQINVQPTTDNRLAARIIGGLLKL